MTTAQGDSTNGWGAASVLGMLAIGGIAPYIYAKYLAGKGGKKEIEMTKEEKEKLGLVKILLMLVEQIGKLETDVTTANGMIDTCRKRRDDLMEENSKLVKGLADGQAAHAENMRDAVRKHTQTQEALDSTIESVQEAADRIRKLEAELKNLREDAERAAMELPRRQKHRGTKKTVKAQRAAKKPVESAPTYTPPVDT